MEKNFSTYERTVSLLMERFPALGLMAKMLPYQEPIEEILPSLCLDKVEVLYIYGLGRGSAYFQCREWLKAHPQRKLIFLEDEPGIIGAFLHREESLEILSDPQMHLELFSKKKTEIANLAQRFPVQRMEVSALPSKGRFQNLRLRLFRQTALSHALLTDRLHGEQPFKNFVENRARLASSFYANGLQKAFLNVPAVVCGAGPSLHRTLDILRNLENKALIIAGGSTLAALSSQGILPHFGMAIDPNLEEYRRLRNSFAFEMPLLYSTRVQSAIFQTCNGPFGYMRSGIGGILELWIEEELGLQDPLLGHFLPPESISVTAICVAWAQFLGCNPILLNGIDMAYTGNRRYSPGVAEEGEEPLQEIDAEKSAADRIVERKDRFGKPVYTAVRWLMESASISRFAKKHPEIRFINTTEGGIGFQGIDFIPLRQAVEGWGERDLRKKVYQAIWSSPMPEKTATWIEAKFIELKQSLERVIGYLQVLSGEKKGSAPLAEIELKEEIAFLYLFYDIHQILDPKEPFFWRQWLQLAQKYCAYTDC